MSLKVLRFLKQKFTWNLIQISVVEQQMVNKQQNVLGEKVKDDTLKFNDNQVCFIHVVVELQKIIDWHYVIVHLNCFVND